MATWSERGKVHIWDISQQLISVDNPTTAEAGAQSREAKPLFSFEGHQVIDAVFHWSVCGTCRSPMMASVMDLRPDGQEFELCPVHLYHILT